jgi:hypothetical protein
MLWARMSRDLSFSPWETSCYVAKQSGLAQQEVNGSCVAVFLPTPKLPILSDFHALKTEEPRTLILARFTTPLTLFTLCIASIRNILPRPNRRNNAENRNTCLQVWCDDVE